MLSSIITTQQTRQPTGVRLVPMRREEALLVTCVSVLFILYSYLGTLSFVHLVRLSRPFGFWEDATGFWLVRSPVLQTRHRLNLQVN